MLAGPFAQILAANRARFNARFAEARHFQPRLDPDVFKEHLRSIVAPIVESVARVRADKAPEAAEALYNLSLDLLGQEFLGPNSRYPFIVDGWRYLLPRLPRFVAEAPREFVGSMTNALHNLSITPGARPREWAASLLQLSEVCPDAPTLLKAGQVAAWRAGMAHYRLGALDLCRDLPPPAALAALGLPAQSAHPPLDPLIESLKADPWFRPTSDLRPLTSDLQIVARVGAFRGFGGLFLAPPLVFSSGDQFVVTDGEGSWLLTADCFGATWHRTEAQPSETKSAARFTINRNGQVSVSGRPAREFPELANAQSSAANSATLAVTTPLSHTVYLIALAGGNADDADTR